MAGSEKTGYENSTDHLLENAFYIVTPSGGYSSPDETVSLSEEINAPDPLSGRLMDIAKAIGAIPLLLDYHEHDRVVAAVSHLPHIVASSLVNLVKEADSREGTMKQVAAGGFKDITRIASSSPEMWEQICVTNQEPIAGILERYINSLSQILEEIRHGDHHALNQFFTESRDYRNSFTSRAKGSLAPDYSFSVDVVDEAGAISTIAVILAAKGINIKNIGINNNREQGEGALRITFYEKEAMETGKKQLEKYHYELRP